MTGKDPVEELKDQMDLRAHEVFEEERISSSSSSGSGSRQHEKTVVADNALTPVTLVFIRIDSKARYNYIFLSSIVPSLLTSKSG